MKFIVFATLVLGIYGACTRGDNEACKTCAAAPNDNACDECNEGYYLAEDNAPTCTSCGVTIPGCTACGKDTADVECTACTEGYYLESTSAECKTCNSAITNCVKCSAANSCTDCDSKYYVNSESGCSQCATGCLTCSGGTTAECQSCENGYYKNDTSTTEKCPRCPTGCSTCSLINADVKCSACSDGSTPVNGVCSTGDGSDFGGYLFSGIAILIGLLTLI